MTYMTGRSAALGFAKPTLAATRPGPTIAIDVFDMLSTAIEVRSRGRAWCSQQGRGYYSHNNYYSMDAARWLNGWWRLSQRL
jgi:hypothetical protein